MYDGGAQHAHNAGLPPLNIVTAWRRGRWLFQRRSSTLQQHGVGKASTRIVGGDHARVVMPSPMKTRKLPDRTDRHWRLAVMRAPGAAKDFSPQFEPGRVVTNIPYTVEVRPDTGLTNGKLGIWLFLASEVMLFGALFSTYIILRVGAPEWPHGELSVALGAINTVLLISSSVTMVMAWASLKMNDWAKHRLYLIATFVLAGIFLVNSTPLEHLSKGEGPCTAHSLAIYFTLTGLTGSTSLAAWR
jgi:hypothetical protein